MSNYCHLPIAGFSIQFSLKLKQKFKYSNASLKTTKYYAGVSKHFFKMFFEMGFCYVAQVGLKVLVSIQVVLPLAS